MDIDDKSSEKSNDIFEDDSEIDSIMDTQADNTDYDDNTDDGDDTDDDENNNIDHENGDYDERAWTYIVKPVIQRHKSLFKEKCNEYENDGMSNKNAKRFASDDMYRVYKAGVILQYERLITTMKQLEDSKHHKKILQDLNYFLNKGHMYEKALKLALRKNDDLFYEIIDKTDDESSEEDDSDEDEVTSDEDDSATEVN